MIIADTHVHIYPCYDLSKMLNCAFLRFSEYFQQFPAKKSLSGVLCLTERSDCRIFEALCTKPQLGRSDIHLQVLSDKQAIVAQRGGSSLLILPGRQIVTKERLEVLALTRDLNIQDGVATLELVRMLQSEDVITVLPWSFGKWWFKRGAQVRELLSQFSPGQLFVADSYLRPWGVPTSAVLRSARSLGYAVLGGSDPLPFAGEEEMVCRQAISFSGTLSEDRCAGDFRSALRNAGLAITCLGDRASAWQTAARLRTLQTAT